MIAVERKDFGVADQPKELKPGATVFFTPEPDDVPGVVLFKMRRHRGPSWYVVQWADSKEGHYEREELRYQP